MRLVLKPLNLLLLVLIAVTNAVYLPRLPTQSDKASIFSLNDCTLPCWIGIVPGQTTIAQAHSQIQDKYGQAFNVETIQTNKEYTNAFVLKISAKDKTHSLLVILNDGANAIEDDDSLVHQITIYSHSDINENIYVPTLGDMILLLGKPGCLAPQMEYHRAWPTALYPKYQAKLTFGSQDFTVTPFLTTGLMVSDQPIVCNRDTIPWRGFASDYRTQFLASMQP